MRILRIMCIVAHVVDANQSPCLNHLHHEHY